MRGRKSVAVLSMLALAAFFGACDNGEPPTGTERNGLTVLLTDEPGDIQQAWVQITQIYLQGEGEDGERIVLRDDTVTQNLIELANDAATLVDDEDVPPGTYSQLRFIIPNACIEVETGNGTEVFATTDFGECGEADGVLKLPSGAQTGLKVNLAGVDDGAIQLAGDQRIVLVDFDVSQSFGQRAGRSGMWVMHPVIHATELEFSGSILTRVQLADTVDLPEIDGEPVTLADFRAALLASDGEGGFDPEAEVAVEDPDGDGIFQAAFEFLVPGQDHQIDLLPPEGLTITTEPGTPVSVEVDSDDEAVVLITVTSAELESTT